MEEKDEKMQEKTAANSTVNSADRFEANGGRDEIYGGKREEMRDTAKI